MLPLLRVLKDQREHDMDEVVETLAHEFSLAQKDRDELLPSGRQHTFENRVGWAKTYMKKAGLLDSPARGRVRITSQGLDVLRQNPPRIDVKFLGQFPEFVQFRETRHGEEETGRKGKKEKPETLEEIL